MSLAAGLVAALLAAAPAPPSAPPPARSDEAVKALARVVLARDDLQTALPVERVPVQLPDFLGRALLALLLTGLAIFAWLAGSWLFRALRARSRDPEVEPGAPTAGPAPIAIPSAEAAAAAGRYGEAIHALLLETLEALSRASRLAPSLTSREILRRVRLGPSAREALAGLVTAVEISHFGGATPGEAEYRACLDRFHVFHQSYRSAA